MKLEWLNLDSKWNTEPFFLIFFPKIWELVSKKSGLKKKIEEIVEAHVCIPLYDEGYMFL